jgi:hypothetical protein
MGGTPAPAPLTGSRSGQTTLNTESEGSLGTSWQTARRPLDMTLPPYGVRLDHGAQSDIATAGQKVASEASHSHTDGQTTTPGSSER